MRAERGYPLCTITPKAEASILRGHPWVYDAEILSLDGEPDNGAVVDVVSRKGRYLGTGFYSEHSKIRVRLLSRNTNDRFDEAFWRRKLQWAWEYRKTVMDPEDLDCCRIIFGKEPRSRKVQGHTLRKFGADGERPWYRQCYSEGYRPSRCCRDRLETGYQSAPPSQWDVVRGFCTREYG